MESLMHILSGYRTWDAVRKRWWLFASMTRSLLCRSRDELQYQTYNQDEKSNTRNGVPVDICQNQLAASSTALRDGYHV
jgi:hypothetical protein